MNYTYKIEKIEPKAEYMRVRYSAEGHEDFIRSFNPRQFDQEHILGLITNYATTVVEAWERLAGHPDTVEIETEGAATAEAPVVAENFDPTHVPVIEDQPEFDMFTQYITLNLIEDPMQATVGWTVHDMTAEEQAEYLANWRSFVSVTPRQARLELAKRGQLSNIDQIIASLPADQQEVVQIEWEYAVSIERSSPWVIQLGSALGLDEVGLDELFKAAAVL
jgi:hypothetical protein